MEGERIETKRDNMRIGRNGRDMGQGMGWSIFPC